ncbi:MAG: ABC-2 family transporter protein [Oligoflexia bacterium]|nr:ABC-2 family transporter protein [Oligoflexia bacterium]MBF0367729.1 ABC-2 family transporter protein [Oligoflexia bacterium]
MFINLQAYLTFARLAFQRQNAYRVANWAGLFTNIFFLFFRASLFESIYPSGTTIGGLNVKQALSYVCLTQAILMVIPQWGVIGVDEDIRSGQIATHLSRPINYYLSTLSQRLGSSAFFLLFRTLPILGIGAFVGFLFLPTSIARAALFLLSTFLGAWIAISIHFLAELSAFWMESSRGIKMLFNGLINFFSGMIIPVTFFPESVRQISRFLPFEYTLNTPTLLYLDKGGNVLHALLAQLTWIGILWIVCTILLSYGERKLVVHGG